MNNSAVGHAIGYGKFGHLRNIFQPPNIALFLQPVDAAIGRSYNCAFRLLHVKQILKYVEKLMLVPAENCPHFKLHAAVTTYDAVCMTAKAWHMVPNSVVING